MACFDRAFQGNVKNYSYTVCRLLFPLLYSYINRIFKNIYLKIQFTDNLVKIIKRDLVVDTFSNLCLILTL